MHYAGREDWYRDDPELINKLISVIRTEAIPFLNTVATIEEVLEYLGKRTWSTPSERTLEAFAYTQTLVGNTQVARNILDRLLGLLNQGYDWQQRYRR